MSSQPSHSKPISILKHKETTTSNPNNESSPNSSINANTNTNNLPGSIGKITSRTSATASEGSRGSANGGLGQVEALTFDVFGTVVDWHGSVVRALERKAEEGGGKATGDWAIFARQWRAGYYTMTSLRAADDAEGSLNVDEMHREILEGLLKLDQWSHLAPLWNEKDRQELVMSWHRLDGWPDSSKGLHMLKKKYLIATLSNGNVRLLADMAKYSDLPWDVIFSGELLGTYKPNPKMYLLAAHHLSVHPSKVAMVAAHKYDLRAAAAQGMRTIYVRRPTEDEEAVRVNMKSKEEGGEVDLVVDSFEELARALGCVDADEFESGKVAGGMEIEEIRN